MTTVEQTAEATPAPVVTQAAPVVAETAALELNTDLASYTQEEYRAWQKDGTVPEKKAKEAEPAKPSDAAPEKPEDKAKKTTAQEADEQPDADDEAESEASDAGTDKPKQPKQKTQADNERRFQKLLKEKRELANRLAVLEELATKGKAETKAEPAPAKAEAKQEAPPKAPRFKDFEDKENGWELYEDARDKHALAVGKYEAQKALEARDLQAKADAEKAEAAKVADAWKSQLKKAAVKYEDFNEVAAEAPTTDLMNGFMVDSDVGAEMLYHFGENPDEAHRIGALPPPRAIRELVALEQKLTGTAKPKAEEPKAAEKPLAMVPKQTTKAGPPARELPGTVAASDAIEEAIARGNYAAYEKEANAREARARRGG